MDENKVECCSEAHLDHPIKRIRVVINACWNCKNLNISDDIEHEDGGGKPYCLMDGCEVHPFNKCQDWEEDSYFDE